MREQHYRWTDRETDRQHYDAKSQLYCVQHDPLKMKAQEIYWDCNLLSSRLITDYGSLEMQNKI